MKKIQARFNCGQWIWDCPCGAGNKIAPGQSMAFCGECYPDKFAVKEAVLNGVVIRGYDKKKQDLAKSEAYQNKKVYKISFPKEHKEIVEILRVRKEEHQSWEVGETVDDLANENKKHPALKYIKHETKNENKETKREKQSLTVLDDDTLRRIY